MSKQTRESRRLNFPLLLFMVSLLLTFVVWDQFLNSKDLLGRKIVSYLILVMGTLYSVSAGLFAWRQEKLDEKIRASLREKEIMLKEIHHRVKNNLQAVVSLLNFQMRDASDEMSTYILGSCRSRIYTMALIHDMLYESKDMARIRVSTFLSRLAKSLMQTMKINQDELALKMRLGDESWDMDRAVACGLLVHELLLHAMPRTVPKEGIPQVWIHHEVNHKSGWEELRIGESGTGLREPWEPKDDQMPGVRLVSILIQQLEGTLNIHRNGHVEYVIRYPFATGISQNA